MKKALLVLVLICFALIACNDKGLEESAAPAVGSLWKIDSSGNLAPVNPNWGISAADGTFSGSVAIGTTGAESLNETDFATSTKWNANGDWTISGGVATYTHSSGTGTLIQTAANLATAGVANAMYKLEYTVSSVTTGCTAYITNSFPNNDLSISMVAGTYTVYFVSSGTMGNFNITVTSTAGGFSIDDISVKRISGTLSGGDYIKSANLTANKKERFFAGTIYPAGASGTADRWKFINDSDHTFFNFTGTVRASAGYVDVFFPVGTKVITFLTCLDNDLASLGYFSVGQSVGLGSARIYLMRGVRIASGKVVGTASSATNAFYLDKNSGVSAASYDQATGYLTLTHTSFGTAYPNVQITPWSTVAAGYTPKVVSYSGASVVVAFVDAAGTVRTGAATAGDIFYISVLMPPLLVDHTTWDTGNIWMFGIIEDAE